MCQASRKRHRRTRGERRSARETTLVLDTSGSPGSTTACLEEAEDTAITGATRTEQSAGYAKPPHDRRTDAPMFNATLHTSMLRECTDSRLIRMIAPTPRLIPERILPHGGNGIEQGGTLAGMLGAKISSRLRDVFLNRKSWDSRAPIRVPTRLRMGHDEVGKANNFVASS